MFALKSAKQKINSNTSNHLKKFGTIYAFLLLVVINMIITPNFASINTFWNLSIQVLPIMLTALGMTFVISSGGIDISVGSIMAVAAVINGMVLIGGIPWAGDNMILGVLLALLLSVAIGFFIGAVVAFFKIQPIIVTLIVNISGRGLAQLLNDGGTVVFYNNAFTNIGVYRIGGVIPIQMVVIAFFIAVVVFLMKKTTFGYYVQAIGENRKAARLSGINTNLITILIYVISAAMACFAGLFESSRASCADPSSIGDLAELDAIAAVAVGGTAISGGKARIIGTIFGALIIQLVTIMVNMNNIPFAFSRIFKAAIIIFAVYLQKEKKSV